MDDNGTAVDTRLSDGDVGFECDNFGTMKDGFDDYQPDSSIVLNDSLFLEEEDSLFIDE